LREKKKKRHGATLWEAYPQRLFKKTKKSWWESRGHQEAEGGDCEKSGFRGKKITSVKGDTVECVPLGNEGEEKKGSVM